MEIVFFSSWLESFKLAMVILNPDTNQGRKHPSLLLKIRQQAPKESLKLAPNRDNLITVLSLPEMEA